MTRTPLITLLAAALLAGCGADSSDRAGGDKPVKAKVLSMANVNGELGELEAFDEAVRRVSGGRLRIRWLNEYGSGRDGNAEVNLIRDVTPARPTSAGPGRASSTSWAIPPSTRSTRRC